MYGRDSRYRIVRARKGWVMVLYDSWGSAGTGTATGSGTRTGTGTKLQEEMENVHVCAVRREANAVCCISFFVVSWPSPGAR